MKFSLLKFMFALAIPLFNGDAGGGGFMGQPAGGGSGEPSGGEPGGDPAGGEPSGPSYKYPEDLDSSYHGNPTLLKYANEDGSFNHANIMKSLIHANSQLGTEKISVPNKDFTEEQWRETFHKLGLPQDISEYEISNNLQEGQVADEKLFEGFKEVAHKAGILPSQAQAVADYFNEQMLGQSAQTQEQYQAKLERDTAELKKEWGEEGFDKNLTIAEQALGHFVTDQNDMKEIVESGFLDNKAVTKLFYRLGMGLQEDTFDHQTKGSFGMDNNQLDERIGQLNGELRDMGRTHPQYQAKLKEYQDALNKRHGIKPVSPSARMR